MAEYVAASRLGVRGVVMLSGALDPAEIDVTWPRGAPAQVHYTFDDPFREQEGIDAVVAAVKSAGATIEVFDYPGAGHVFADPSKANEYQLAEAQLMWSRVTDFVERIAS
jgi:dienelactone hydrolase